MANKLYTTLGIALIYVLTAQLGFLFSLLPFWEVTLIWPPSGIALAGVILLGRIALPGIFLGALITNLIALPHTLSPAVLGVVCVTIATTSTLSPLVASEAIKRIVPNGPTNVSAAQLLAVSCTNFLACFISTAGGITSLYLCGVIPREIILSAGAMWWLGDFCGMMIVGPICWMVYRFLKRAPRKAGRDPIATALLVNSAFVGAALLVFMALWSFETGNISRLLTSEARLAASNVAQVLREAERDIDRLRALAYASETFENDEFQRYTTAKFRDGQRHVAQAVGWAPRVTDPGVWEKEVKNGIPAGIRLHERDDSGQKIPVRQREAYFPVQYIQPLEGNQAAIGFDLGSERSRRIALERARDTGQVSMVSPIVLVQSVDAEPAMLICVPIYRPEVLLDTVEARRGNLTGFVSAVHLIRPLFTASLAETDTDMDMDMDMDMDIDFHLFERSQTGEATWYHTIASSNSATNDSNIAPEPAPTLASLETGLNGIAPVNFAEHQWLVVAKPGATLTRDKRTLGPWAVMLLIITLGIVSSSVLLERISARRDIMLERRKSEEAFLEARAANDSKTFFMAAAGHDIKQPLYALGLLTDTLLMSHPKPSSIPLIRHLRKSIDSMGEQFDDLMSAGKLNHGNFEPILKKVHLAGIIAPVDAEITLLCADKGLRWNLDLENAIVITDPLLLQRLLRNLLSNAVRYTNDGEVSCSAIARGKFVEFRISDTGKGIALSNQKEMFDKFVLRDDYPYDSTGNGLGLHIVAKINQALDLGLQIFSAPGGGTAFSFQVPLAPK